MEYNFKQLTRRDQIFTLINYIFLILFILIVIYPLIFVLSASFSNPVAVVNGKMWLLPVGFNVEGYKALFGDKGIIRGFTNSFLYTGLGTLINVVLTILAAYPLSRKDFIGRNIFMFMFVFTMMFSGGLIPTYLLVKELGLLNTVWAMVLPNALAVWNVIITRTYFQVTIPVELLEAAQMDGCSDIRFMRSVVLPLSGPILAVITLFYAVGHWNQYFNAMIYLHDKSLFPLQLILRDILIRNDIDVALLGGKDAEVLEHMRELLKYAVIIVSSIPVVVLYPFVQRHFVKGVMIGSLKG